MSVWDMRFEHDLQRSYACLVRTGSVPGRCIRGQLEVCLLYSLNLGKTADARVRACWDCAEERIMLRLRREPVLESDAPIAASACDGGNIRARMHSQGIHN